MSNSIALSFNSIQLSPVEHNSQIWLTSVELANALGYSRPDKVSQIYDRNKDEFNDNMSTVLKSPRIEGMGESSGLQREQRIFSLRGCHLLAMFSRTAIAKEFRKWVLDILDNQIQPALNQLLTPPAPRAKTYIKGGLELHQQDAINDFIKERVAIVPEHKRKGITVMIYSAICIKFDVKGMTHGYKNIVPEQFDNIIQLIARLPIHDEKAMLFFTQDEFDSLIAERVKAIEGEVMPNEVTNSITINLAPTDTPKRWLLTQSRSSVVTMSPIDDDQEVMSREGMIRELRHDSNYIIFDKTGLSARQIVMHHIPPQFLPDMIEEAGAMLRRTEAGKLQA